MPWTNYHSHTIYCDGLSAADAYIKKAIEQGLAAYGYSSHAPLPFFCEWTIPQDKLKSYINDVITIKEKYSGKIQVYLGLEIDFIPGVTGPADKGFKKLGLDYTIGSVHFVDCFDDGTRWGIDHTFELFVQGMQQIFKNDAKKAVCRFFELTREMVAHSTPDIIGHLDKIRMFNKKGRFFDENAGWYRNEVEETLQVIKEKNVMVEVNTRGFYRHGGDFSPAPAWFHRLKSLDIPVVLNSDAHEPGEVIQGCKEAAILLKEAGVDHLYALMDGKWKPFGFDTVKGINL